MIRVAATGDLHLGLEAAGLVRPQFAEVADHADVLLLAGDLTRVGSVEEAGVVCRELGELDVPTFAVLGNHDYHGSAATQIVAMLEDAGISVLEGRAEVVELGCSRLGVAGVKGFGGGFVGLCATEFGELETKAFVHRAEEEAAALAASLVELRADVVVALTHYAPTDSTLGGEPPQIHPFLGSYQLGEAIDNGHVDLAVHGHAHRGVEIGSTPGGVHVRNVAQPVIGRAYRVYCVGGGAVEAADLPAVAGVS